MPNKFDAVEFRERLRNAREFLQDAIDMLQEQIADPDPEFPFEEPGPNYLLGRLDMSIELIEQQLPEFQQAATASIVDALLGAEDVRTD